ncbi:hypothetical protein TEA_008298 [Camellia sinensis var. sinensis]|uniref:Uncharacterized protein n=1 Tax=Camellia sinensis var. sinensis TaxID=542762 RepID=A0A4S4ESP7_CAMSN|nr:hypothetical protein TEA_008298 [Camellia sinensis var. sinensis]
MLEPSLMVGSSAGGVSACQLGLCYWSCIGSWLSAVKMAASLGGCYVGLLCSGSDSALSDWTAMLSSGLICWTALIGIHARDVGAPSLEEAVKCRPTGRKSWLGTGTAMSLIVEHTTTRADKAAIDVAHPNMTIPSMLEA